MDALEQAVNVRLNSKTGRRLTQIGIQTDESHGKARIQSVDAGEMEQRLARNEVAVITGFQGVTARGRISTLGRGGSDTTAVAVAAALKADRCDIYTDVSGVYTADPRIVLQARKLARISYEEMLEMASLGARVLMTRSVEIAMKMNVPLQVLSSFEGGGHRRRRVQSPMRAK